MLLLVVEAASPALPAWLAFPLFALALLGLVGIVYSVRGLLRLFSPAENAFTFSAAEPVFRFTLTRPGQYEVGCTRPGRWGRLFTLPPVVLEVQALAGGATQHLTPPRLSYVKRSNLGGDTTLRFDTFRASMAGEYELRNPGAAQFEPGDQLRIIPAAGFKMVLFILATIFSAFAMLGGGIVGLLALMG
ncbi:hypothetical protein ACFST9_23850 [Hymenobacter monticola]|uniref:DUF3592 domain-containing protein n=1 Tax=Hymenobacter monticola TaxID=1705399 RepID=A0ABY4B784_9BACT|nr:hypothetical protein [Hymenobacter monticola]UOE33866.1 hypothetical protein MTP16_22475 [Hymenobacter monticola]